MDNIAYAFLSLFSFIKEYPKITLFCSIIVFFFGKSIRSPSQEGDIIGQALMPVLDFAGYGIEVVSITVFILSILAFFIKTPSNF